MTSFYLLAWRNLRTRLTRTLLTAAGIVLGVAVILAIDVTNRTTLASIRDMFDEASGKASLMVEAASSGQGGFDRSLLADARRVPGVELAAPSLYARTLLVSEADEWNIQISLGGGSSAGLLMVGVDPALDPQVRVYQMSTGRYLEPDEEQRSVVLTQEYAEKKDLSVGSDLEILSSDGPVAFEIVGLMESEGVGRLSNGAVGVIPLSVAQDVFRRGRSIDQIDVVLSRPIADSPERLEAMKVELENRLGREVNVTFPASRGKLISQMLATYQQGLGFFSVVALFVGAFLIYNAFSMTVIERTHEIGMLRALGARRRQIWGLILIEAGLLGTIGSALGLLAGWGLALGLIRGMSSVVGTTLNVVSISLSGVLTALLVGLGVTLVSAFLPARRASLISPLEALRVTTQKEGDGLMRRLVWITGAELLAVGWLVIYRIPLARRGLLLRRQCGDLWDVVGGVATRTASRVPVGKPAAHDHDRPVRNRRAAGQWQRPTGAWANGPDRRRAHGWREYGHRLGLHQQQLPRGHPGLGRIGYRRRPLRTLPPAHAPAVRPAVAVRAGGWLHHTGHVHEHSPGRSGGRRPGRHVAVRGRGTRDLYERSLLPLRCRPGQ